jgi:hypothetical protein
MVVGKTGSFVFFTQYPFLSHFDLRHLEKTIKTLLSQSMMSKNPINCSKTRNSPEIKKNLKLRYVVLGVFKKEKKTLQRNLPHHMKLFDTEINYFCGCNLPQQPLFLSKQEFGDSLSLLPTKNN